MTEQKSLHSLSGGVDLIRTEDDWGSGQYGAPREDRTHRGVDIVIPHGGSVFCPFDATIVREACPYDDDARYSGVLLAGQGAWEGYEIKLFYIECQIAGEIVHGKQLGTAQDIGLRYTGITPHVHMELWRGDTTVDPTPFLKKSP